MVFNHTNSNRMRGQLDNKMKNLALVLLAGLFLSACRQNQKSENAPEAVAKAFHQMRPGAVITEWKREPGIWEAKYTDGDESGAIAFDEQGNLVETELVITPERLPGDSLIPKFVREHYQHESIQRAEMITRADGSVFYEVQITGKELVFDASGKFLEEEPD